MKLMGRNQMMVRHSTLESIRFFQDCGYDGIELSVLRGMQTVNLDLLDDYAIQSVNAACAQKENFLISALACHSNYVTDDFIFGVQKRLLQTVRRYGTDIVIMSTFTPFEERESHTAELYAKLETRTRELVRVAEDCGVRIAIEVEPNQLFRNLTIFLDMAEKIGSPALKLNFDVGHIYLSEVDLHRAIGRAAPYIVHSHIDNMCMGEHCHKLPWDGEIDLVDAYRTLRESGFDGCVSLDVYLQDYATVAPECARYIKNEVFAKL